MSNSWELFLTALARAVEKRGVKAVAKDGSEGLSDTYSLEVNRTALAQIIGSDMGYVSKIFSGKAKPSLSMARRISKALGVTTDELCDALGLNGVHLRDGERLGRPRKGNS